jgi:MFS family permease
MAAVSPLRHRIFRALWVAQFVSNTGTWAQTVGAQWLMGDLGGSALQVALVQTATSLPIFLLVVPAGALGDILDRRRLVLGAQALMLTASATLAVVAASDAATPALLLALVATSAVGQAVALPSFRAIQSELVPREEIAQAALLQGANFNVARALGPALGGALIGAVGPEATFALNALTFLAVLGVVASWRRPRDLRLLGSEHITTALRAGARYVASAPRFKVVLARSVLFVFFASALWALLPVVARGPLGLGAGGYGLLLGSVGFGAVAGAFVLPGIRARVGPNALVATATIVYGAAMLVVALAASVAASVAALVVAGLAWIAVLSTLNASAQLMLPDWTRARGLAFYTLTFMGGQALGSLVWGTLASTADLDAAHAAAAAGLVLGPALGLGPLGLKTGEIDTRLSNHWPEPHVLLEPDPKAGPVLVTVEWRVATERAGAFVDAMQAVGRSRRRTGALRWGIFRDAADPEAWLETFVVATWQEHMRQHVERGTAGDEELEARARGLCVDGAPPRVRHLLSGYRPG